MSNVVSVGIVPEVNASGWYSSLVQWLDVCLYFFMFYQGEEDGEAARDGSDVLDFIQERINLSLAEIATSTGDDATRWEMASRCVCVCRMFCRLWDRTCFSLFVGDTVTPLRLLLAETHLCLLSSRVYFVS